MTATLNTYDNLTSREYEVLELMAQGLTNREIADQLVIEFETVRWYTKQVYSKLGVHSRSQAILRAQELNLLENAAAELPSLPPHSLPTYATPFVGRKELLDELMEAIRSSDYRLITLAGLGGVGKTRLAVEAARHLTDDFSDGVYFIPLESAHSESEIISTILHCMHLHTDNLFSYLKDKELLFILDNFDHGLTGLNLVNDLILQSPKLTVMVTSRASLNLRKEWVRYIDGVSVPDSLFSEEAKDYDAIKLFMQCVRQVRGDYSFEENRECVIRLCQLVRGVPLAIELAASWMKTLSCRDIISEIERDLDFLSTQQRDVEARHSSLRVVFDHTWQMLTEEEQRMVCKLSVFRGGYGREFAQQISGASLKDLASLVDKSIIHQDGTGFITMHELLRQYAEEQLAHASAQVTLGAKTSVMAAWGALVHGKFQNAIAHAGTIVNATVPHKPPEVASALALMGILAGIEEDYQKSYQLSKAGLDLIHNYPVQDPITLSLCYLGLAIANCGMAYYEDAAAAITNALKLTNNMRVVAFTTLCLPITSIILAHTVEPERAVQVMALAFSYPASTPEWMRHWPVVNELQSDLRAELGTEAYDAAWTSGQALHLNTVVSDLLRSMD